MNIQNLVCGICVGLGLSTAAESLTIAAELQTVPTLKGQTRQRAEQVCSLAGLKLSVGMLYVPPADWRDDIEPNVVYLQTPQPGGVLPEGATLAAWSFAKAAADQPTVKMPDLRGQSFAEARRELSALGLRPMPIDESTDGDATVLDHYPRPGQTVYRGTSAYLAK